MKALALAALALVLIVAGYALTHEPIYSQCHMTDNGKVCTLVGYK